MGRKRGTDTKGRKFSDEVIDRVWGKGKPVPGKNPDLYRQDAVGTTVYKPFYGKDSNMGWQIDHKKPVKEGGTDNLRSLQPLQTKKNKEKGDQYPWKP